MTTTARHAGEVRGWVERGTALLLDAVAGLDAGAFDVDTTLPGWTRRHLLAHVASNAEALGRLVEWAATGEPRPMYASPGERAAGIERGAMLSPQDLVAWATTSAAELATAWSALTKVMWSHEVVTAQGRAVAAAEIPWLRAREVCVHAVDLAAGVGFADLPRAFLVALCDEIRGRRSLVDGPTEPIADVAAWLSGRPHRLDGVAGLGRWL